MKIILILSFLFSSSVAASYIRVNQVGYFPEERKKAIVGSDIDLRGDKFVVIDYENNSIVFSGVIQSSVAADFKQTPFKYTHEIDFSSLHLPGVYFVELEDKTTSHHFQIGEAIYYRIIDSLLYYMRVARCGNTKPELHEPCHLYDATYTNLDLTGGWHDAGDFLKFSNKTAYTTYTLLLSYEINIMNTEPLFSDLDNNGLVDILDEAKIGLDYLVKIYPDPETFILMVGDFEADHNQGSRLPEHDQLAKHNRPARFGFDRNSLAKYAYTMALAFKIFNGIKKFEGEAYNYLLLAERAYNRAKMVGDGEKDKLCLAAIELFYASNDYRYLEEAEKFNDQLGSSTWGHRSDNTNFAHARIAPFYPSAIDKLKESVSKLNNISQKHIFGYNVQYIWASLYVAISTGTVGCLYKTIAADDLYADLQRNILDYTLGINPWGICFISKIGAVYPQNIHNNVAKMLKGKGLLNIQSFAGAVAEGPFDRIKWEKMLGSRISSRKDKFKKFQPLECVYHDIAGDYITNEPCIYGVSETILFFSSYLNRMMKSQHAIQN